MAQLQDARITGSIFLQNDDTAWGLNPGKGKLFVNSDNKLQYTDGSGDNTVLSDALTSNPSIDALSNVSISGVPSNDAVLKYNSSTDMWEPGTDSSGAGGVTSVTAGFGLGSNGTTGAVELGLDFSELIDMTADISGTTEFILQDGVTESRKAASEIKLSAFNNDSNFTSNVGDIESVTAGTGLTGGGTSGGVTLNVTGVLEDLNTLGAPSSDGEIIVATGPGAFQYESAATFRTTIGVDAAGTDNSTPVTIATGKDYISISGQELTLGTIDIDDDTNLDGGTGITLTGNTLSTTDSEIVHDNLSGFVANEHIDHSTVNITAGTGLSGGGDLTATRTLNVSGLTVDELAAGSLQTSGESFADNDTSLMTSAAIQDKILSYGYSATTGTVTSVAAGTGLDGGTFTDSGTLSLSDSGVSDGTYGDASNVPRITVDAKGRITSVTEVSISGGGGSIDVSGTPADNQIAIWTDSDTLEGTGSLAYVDSKKSLAVNLDTHSNAGASVSIGGGAPSIGTDTQNASDNKRIYLASYSPFQFLGNPIFNSNRGAYMYMAGNESTGPGDIYFVAGDGSASDAGQIFFYTTIAGNTSSSKVTISGSNLGIGVVHPDQKLEVSGAIHISEEQGSAITQPSDGDGGILYTKADGKIYWVSNELSETDLTATGGGGGGSGDITRVNITAGTGLSGTQDTTSGDHTQTLSVDASQTQITAIGTITTGVWQGTQIADDYISSAATWNGKTVMNGTQAGGILTYSTSTQADVESTATYSGTTLTLFGSGTQSSSGYTPANLTIYGSTAEESPSVAILNFDGYGKIQSDGTDVINGLNWAGNAITAAKGGTGLTSAPTIGEMLYGSGTGNYAILNQGSADQVLAMHESAGVPVWKTITEGHTTEEIQDIVGAMFTGNTETNITATYEDGDGTIDLVVPDYVLMNGDTAGGILTYSTSTEADVESTLTWGSGELEAQGNTFKFGRNDHSSDTTFLFYSDLNDGQFKWDASADYFEFTDVVRHDDKLGVGTSGAPTYQFHVKGQAGTNAADGWIASFHNAGGSWNSNGIIIVAGENLSGGSPTKDTEYITAMDSGASVIGKIVHDSATGDFEIMATSDQKLKDNIRTTQTKGLESIMGIGLFDFEWKTSGNTTTCGFVAQDLEKHYPDAVSEHTEENGEVTKMVSKTSLVPPMIKAMQEQQELIETLMARVQELENKIN